MKLNWFTKLFMKFFPFEFLKYSARDQGIDDEKLDCAMKLFDNAKVDIFNCGGSAGERGFIIILDNKLSLFFYQDGEGFKFDGYEMGEYENGDVTIFDKLK